MMLLLDKPMVTPAVAPVPVRQSSRPKLIACWNLVDGKLICRWTTLP